VNQQVDGVGEKRTCHEAQGHQRDEDQERAHGQARHIT
jgi:hypothetical protein